MHLMSLEYGRACRTRERFLVRDRPLMAGTLTRIVSAPVTDPPHKGGGIRQTSLSVLIGHLRGVSVPGLLTFDPDL